MLIPHQHQLAISSKTCSVQTEQAQDFFDWIKRMIHNDLGAEHLEHFGSTDTAVEQPAKTIHFSKLFFDYFYADDLLIPDQTFDRSRSFALHWRLPLSLYYNDFQLRGPPAMTS